MIAHPWRRDAWKRYDPSWAQHLTALEVWNRKYDGLSPSRPALELARRDNLREFVSLDFHTSKQFFPLAMALRLPGEVVSRDAVHSALRSGAFDPMLFSRSALKFMRGPALRTLETLETARRAVRRLLR